MTVLKKKMIISAICIGLSTACMAPLSFANDNPYEDNVEIGHISYKTITGENGAFMDTDTDEFVLNQKEWFEIQSYVEGALGLPKTKQSMVKAFDIKDGVQFSDFEPLLTEYQSVYNSAYYWKNALYPHIVDLALSIGNYTDIQNYMLQPLANQFNVILSKSNSTYPEDMAAVEQARQMSLAYLQMLANFSHLNQAKADNATRELLEYATQMEAQKAQLETLRATHAQYTEDDGSDLQARVNELNNRVKTLNEQYIDYVVISSTAVTYSWVPVIAIPIMGIYGDKAEKARKLRNELTKEVAELKEKLSTTQKVHNSYKKSVQSIDEISEKINAALPHVTALKLHWQKINVDFDSLITALTAAEKNAQLLNNNAFIAAIGAMANTSIAERNWKNISDKARAFANKAYVKELTEE